MNSRYYTENYIGQGYAGDYADSPGAGVSSAFPPGSCVDNKIKVGASEKVELRALMERLQQYLYRYRIRAKDCFKVIKTCNSCKIFNTDSTNLHYTLFIEFCRILIH